MYSSNRTSNRCVLKVGDVVILKDNKLLSQVNGDQL